MTSAHKPDKKPIETYEHKDKQRLNNPPVGLVTPETDQEEGSRSYSHDPHLDPQFVWAGKAEHTSFLVPTVSLHVHERIDLRTIIAAVRRRSGQGAKRASLFEFSGENLPVREAIEFYKHRHGWSRLAKNLKAEVDGELMEAYRGTLSLPFQPGPHERVAVKIIDDRGIESLRIMEVK